MADTGAPWNIPFVEPTDLVRDYPAADEAQALAVAAGLSAAGGLVAVKSAIFTGVQTISIAAGGNAAVEDLTISHALADASNRLIISAFFGAVGNSGGSGQTGIAIHDGTGLIAVGAADGARTRVAAGGSVTQIGTIPERVVAMPSITFVHSPGDTSERTYTVRAVNIRGESRTTFINRSESDANSAANARAVSSLVIQEVKV